MLIISKAPVEQYLKKSEQYMSMSKAKRYLYSVFIRYLSYYWILSISLKIIIVPSIVVSYLK